MANEAEDVAAYLNTVDRLEPNIHPLDQDGALASIAVSLKRIADTLDAMHDDAERKAQVLAMAVEGAIWRGMGGGG